MIDKEDLIKGFAFINPNVNYVRLGAGVLVAPHTDPFLHPQIYDFIKIASEYFPTKKITTVTTGAYIREDKLESVCTLQNTHPIPQYWLKIGILPNVAISILNASNCS